jgi:hypothetical protein
MPNLLALKDRTLFRHLTRRDIMVWVLIGSAVISFFLGLSWRTNFILKSHPPSAHIYGDMKQYVDFAIRLANPRYQINQGDTALPPGLPFLASWFYRWDPTWHWMDRFFWLISALIPINILFLANRLFGTRTALIAFSLSNLYFPFIEYGGFFLCEIYFLFLASLASLFAVKGIQGISKAKYFFFAVSGMVWAIAIQFKGNALPISLFSILGIALLAFLKKEKALGMGAAISSLTLFLLLIPSALSCTKHFGNFCVSSSNFSFNFAVGHTGRVKETTFLNGGHWNTPSHYGKLYSGVHHIPLHWYQTKEIVAHVWEWTKANPIEAFTVSSENVFDTFFGTPWPAVHESYHGIAFFYQGLFWVFILFPALYFLIRSRKKWLSATNPALPQWILLSPLIALLLTAFFVLGEYRYRVPMDFCLIILASAGYAGKHQTT